MSSDYVFEEAYAEVPSLPHYPESESGRRCMLGHILWALAVFVVTGWFDYKEAQDANPPEALVNTNELGHCGVPNPELREDVEHRS